MRFLFSTYVLYLKSSWLRILELVLVVVLIPSIILGLDIAIRFTLALLLLDNATVSFANFLKKHGTDILEHSTTNKGDDIPVSDFEFVPKDECYTCRYRDTFGGGYADVGCRKDYEGLDCEYIEDDDYIRR